MPSSNSLITSWTLTSFVPSGTRFPQSSRRKAFPGDSSALFPRSRVLKHLHKLWTWKGTSSSSRKSQLTSDPMLRRVSSTISISRVQRAMLASTRPSPTAPSSLILSPLAPSPTTPAFLPSGVDTDSNAIKLSEVEPRPACGILLSDPFFNDLSPSLPFSRAPTEPEPALGPSFYGRQRVSLSLPSLPGHSPLPPPRPVVTGCSTSGYTLDAATWLQDFRALIDELRATLLHRDSKEEFDTGSCDYDDYYDDEERERLVRLLEDVMLKVQQLGENDTPRVHAKYSQLTV